MMTVPSCDDDELKELLAKVRVNGVLRGSPDEPGQRLMTATIAALEKLERENPGILMRRPRLAMLLAEIAKPCRSAIGRET